MELVTYPKDSQVYQNGLENKFMKKFKSLKEFNEEKEQEYFAAIKYPKLNALECPLCKNELQDLDNRILCSFPAKRNVGCSKCSYVGYRIA